MYLAFAVHRLPGGQQQDELAGHARLVAAEALAKHGLRWDHLSRLDDPVRQYPDDAGGSGGGYVVLGEGAELNREGAAMQPLLSCH